MAKLKVFVSSTCIDLTILRSELRPFIFNMGHEPVMSEYSEVLYDPSAHTHKNCVDEVPNCDMMIVIIGSRFGGVAVPAALVDIDDAILNTLLEKSDDADSQCKVSISHIEVIKAIQNAIPIYVFVENKVLHDHHVFQKNMDKKDIIDRIEFPSIEKPDTAKFIFNFINFIRKRSQNNAIVGFDSLEQIRLHLVSQWSQLFQHLLIQRRKKEQEQQRVGEFSERIDDLKAVILASLASSSLNAVAKSAIRYRHLIAFVCALHFISQKKELLLSDKGWNELIKAARIVKFLSTENDSRISRFELILVLDDQTFYLCRYESSIHSNFSADWDSFRQEGAPTREAVINALLEDGDRFNSSKVKYYRENVDLYLGQRLRNSQKYQPNYSSNAHLTMPSFPGPSLNEREE